MKKYLIFLLTFFFASANLMAQRDTDHWFAPMKAAQGVEDHSIYFSTDSTTPFPVQIFSNNVLLGTVTVAKGNPQVFAVPQDRIFATTTGQCFTVTDLGLHTKGTKPYYAQLRFTNLSHGEIVTSKGKAGIGKEFYAVLAPLVQSSSTDNFTVGMLATEDNTTVTVSGYNNSVVFSNGVSAGVMPTMTFTLNKGQSYIVEGISTIAANRTGFIGAKIVASKPISVTNGHIGGNYWWGTSGSTGSDFEMDQSVPTDRLGDQFVMIKGYGSINDGTEGAVVVATENNTEIRINGVGAPVATINAGQYYLIKSNYYINQGSGHYNMYIKTTKNVYVYQLLSGQSGNNNTEGYNYIPPLNCYLPRKIDELGKIHEMPDGSSNTIKLNILTEKGAVVTINGVVPPASEGPFNVTGTNDWVSYSKLGATGNFTVVSNKAVTAGIAGGSGTMGYGGYFAGFSSIPVIAKQTGECIPGIKLEVDDGFDSYQWYRNGVAIPGATTYTYTPTQAGNYTCVITVGTCAPVTTPVYKVFTCLKESTTTITACAPTEVKPTFTMTTTQTPVPSSTTIITQPTNGTVVINPINGFITYTPASGFIGNDSFVFKFCGNDPEFTDCEQVTVTVTVPDLPVVNNAILTECYIPATPAQAVFDLTSAVVTAMTPATYAYFPSYSDALNNINEITTPLNYLAPSSEVFVRVYSPGGCYAIAKITLKVTPPTYSTVLMDKYICVEDRATLDAGPGFTYLWSTGATTQSISNVGIGEYWVDLFKDGCVTRQTVRVYKFVNPVVKNIEISNNTVTLTVDGGTPPYQYSLDGIIWQSSNVFTNLPRGQNRFYIKDANDCDPFFIEATVPNIVNAITPNNDGVNDYFDYSDLGYKENLVINIYDRYGAQIHQANKKNGYKWDGRNSNREIQTGTYWYEVTWNEPNGTKVPVKFTGWILVKNK